MRHVQKVYVLRFAVKKPPLNRISTEQTIFCEEMVTMMECACASKHDATEWSEGNGDVGGGGDGGIVAAVTMDCEFISFWASKQTMA